jgi:hypothetical protein
VARAHQIAAHVLARAHQVAQRLLLGAGDPHRVQPANHQQPHQALGVAAVGLDAILRRPLDLPGRRDHAPDARDSKPPSESEPGQTGLIGHLRRARQPGAERHHLRRLTRQPVRAQLPGLAIDRHRDHLRGMHIQTSPTANLGHGRLLLCGCGRRAGCHPHGSSHPTIAWGTGQYLPVRPDDNLHTV